MAVPVLDRSERGFGVGVVVGDPCPGEGSQHAHLLQPRFQRGPAHLFEKPAARHCRYRHGGLTAAGGPCCRRIILRSSTAL